MVVNRLKRCNITERSSVREGTYDSQSVEGMQYYRKVQCSCLKALMMVNGLKGVQDYRKVQNKSTIKNLSKGNYDSSLDFGGLNPPPHPTNLHI